MKPRTIIKRCLRAALIVGVLLACVVGYGFLPGRIEGNYRGVECMCDSVNFMRIADGRVVLYSSGHPPAELIGHYVTGEDGAVDIYMLPNQMGDPDRLTLRAYPRRFFTKIVKVDGSYEGWDWKRPLVGEARRAFDEQEVVKTEITRDRAVLKTFYTKAFELVRQEEILPRTQPKPNNKGCSGGEERTSDCTHG